MLLPSSFMLRELFFITKSCAHASSHFYCTYMSVQVIVHDGFFLVKMSRIHYSPQ